MYEFESLWEIIVIKREELYERIWAEPALKVATAYGITGTGLAKICHKLAIPVPTRGDWARMRAGQTVKRKPLPAVKPGAPVEHRIERLKKRHYAEFSDAARQAAEHERDPGQKIVVPEVLTDPHRLVRSSEALVRRVAAKSAKAKDPPKFCPSPSMEKRCLDIAVTTSCVDRALRIMDALLKALEARGFPVSLSDSKPAKPGRSPWEPGKPAEAGVTSFAIGESIFDFGLREATDTITVPPPAPRKDAFWTPGPTYKYRPNGGLTLELRATYCTEGIRTHWADGKRQRVEDCLNAFIASAITIAERQRLDQIERERQRLEQEERERRAQEERKRQQREAARLKDLNERVEQWRWAKMTAEFLDAVEAEAVARGQAVGAGTPLGDWIAWGRERTAAVHESATAPRLDGPAAPVPR